MNEAFIVLERARREAISRLAKYEQEGNASAHKLPSVRQAIRELDLALYWLKWANGERLGWVRLWNLVEEGERNVQIRNSSNTGQRSNRKR